jgi:hypothetical protein
MRQSASTPNAFRDGFEEALTEGRVWVRMSNGRYWVVRRNGATKLWQTRPDDWAIPCKMGFRGHVTITQGSDIGVLGGFGWRTAEVLMVPAAQRSPNPNEFLFKEPSR